jgi:dGTP triphosphohydrolase
LINDTAARTTSLLQEHEVDSADAVRQIGDRLVLPAEHHQELVQGLLSVLTQRYYRSSDVAGADEAAHRLVTELLDRLVASPATIPERFRNGDNIIDAATYLASLNDFAAADLAQTLGITVP